MPEIKKKPIELKEDIVYIPSSGDVVFTDDHSMADIVRYAVKQTHWEDVQYILDEIKGEVEVEDE